MSESNPTKKVTAVLVFRGGSLAAFGARDGASQQIPELQVSMFQLWVRHALSLGYEIEGMTWKDSLGEMVVCKTENAFPSMSPEQQYHLKPVS